MSSCRNVVSPTPCHHTSSETTADIDLALLLLFACEGRLRPWPGWSYWRKDQWDCLGNKDLSQKEPSAGSSCAEHCRRDCCTLSRCAGACGCGSAETGLPTVSAPSCCSSLAVILWRTSQRATSLRTLCNALNTQRSIPISGSRPGTPFAPASATRCEEPGSMSSSPRTHKSCRRESRSRGTPWKPFMRKTSGSSAMPQTATTVSTSVRPLVILWSTMDTVSSPILNSRACYTNRASRRDGTYHALTSTSLR